MLMHAITLSILTLSSTAAEEERELSIFDHTAREIKTGEEVAIQSHRGELLQCAINFPSSSAGAP